MVRRWLARVLLAFAVASVAACGAPGDTAAGWRGGLVGVWEPAGAPAGSIILHQGHVAFDGTGYAPADLRPVAERFAAAGFIVYGLEMPPAPHEGRPLSDFTAPVARLLDAIGPAYMVGLSGGGFTTTVVTATDSRILRGYSVAGDAPLDVWDGERDPEQYLVEYRALYAAAGARLLHIYNWSDPCCFAGIAGDVGYPYATDYTATSHTITPWAVDFIVADIARGAAGAPIAAQ